MLYLLTFLHGTRRSARLNIFKNNKLSLLQACRTFYCWNDVYSTGGLFEIEDDLSWHNCSQVRLAQFFPSDTGRIVPNRGWHDCSQVKLARLFPGGCGILAFKFIFCFVVCSLARFSLVNSTWEESRHVLRLWYMIPQIKPALNVEITLNVNSNVSKIAKISCPTLSLFWTYSQKMGQYLSGFFFFKIKQ